MRKEKIELLAWSDRAAGCTNFTKNTRLRTLLTLNFALTSRSFLSLALDNSNIYERLQTAIK